ncbi:DoxX family protein [Shewanella waksmanii]|uniref:DoxX family protein n=1 Tax=Shewanella waksmanii TaxID=213783 RepID=UPI00373579A3
MIQKTSVMQQLSAKREAKYLLAMGRVMLGLYFLLPGIMKFISWDTHVALMAKHQMVAIEPLLAIAAVVQIVAGLLLIANRYVAIVALGLALMVLVINVCLHDFWNLSGLEAAHEMQNFVKNLGIFAGLLVLGGHYRSQAR